MPGQVAVKEHSRRKPARLDLGEPKSRRGRRLKNKLRRLEDKLESTREKLETVLIEEVTEEGS
jgi:hypothetical protein